MNTAYLAFANQPPTELRGISKHSPRYLAAAAGQVLAALECQALGDIARMKLHLAQGKELWTKSQAAEEAQVSDAVSKIRQLRADGIGRDIVQPGVTHSGPHMSMGDLYARTGMARGESALKGGR